ncbi:tetratricopeptide (TPR) repeat protein [Pseudoxanthomonas japonensis]|uniref:heme biosynthesis protein HemY n=1 Tax=Pseudoxanthomonas japonensis TaxID=69284 RepID=UPI00285ECF39|nr:tetratricopeptide repeat protein [Pseudoxanthomonas japonensis]MDR7068715.1 tetratricopeptide (TPR) repeat protein [Pseudoxanthomonas japonensis]
MKHRMPQKTLLSLMLLTAFGGAVVADAVAYDARSPDRGGRKNSSKVEVRYPDATREEPKAKASSKMQGKLSKLFKAYEKEGNDAETLTLAKELLAEPNANEYDKAMAAQLGAQAAYNLDDTATAKQLLQQAVDLNALDNNGHYQAMVMLAQLQLQDEEFAPGMANLDRYLAETKSNKPEDLIQKGQALYQMEKYAEAIPVLEKAIASTPEPKDNWYGLLLASLVNADRPAEAVKIAEQMAAKNPTDKKAQLNLVSTYQQADQFDKAAATLEKMRTAGQLTEEKEYRQLYVTYANMDGKEKEVISVVNEGLQKGVLKPDYQTQLALAQAYYYSEQIPQAIAAWQKAAPLAPNGETYLNLARVLWQEDRIPEAKAAARAALDKGLKKPDDAKKIIALP